MISKCIKFVSSSPFPIKQTIRYIYGTIPVSIRYGRPFRETYNLLQESQWWSEKQLYEYQMAQLRKLLNHVYENVPYYQKIFLDLNLKPSDFKNINDLKKLPYLTKDLINDNFEQLIAKNYPKSKLQYVTTGGSTGIPTGFFQESFVSDSKEWAFIYTLWKRVGFRIGDRCVVLRGNVLNSASKGKFWEYDPVNKNLILSAYHMTDDLLPFYIQKIRDFKPDFIQAYPSVITILAKFMKEKNVDPFPTVKAILCGSENLYPTQRELLEDVLGCRVFGFYGHTERAVLAGECEQSNFYHISPEYGIAELIGTDGENVSMEGEIGEIVVTGFNNYAFPLIRYKTADLAIYTGNKCTCGRNYPLLQRIEGRLQELIVSKDNRVISLTSLIFAQHFHAFSKIREMQLFQEEPGILQIKIVKGKDYSYEDEQEVRQKMQNATDNQLELSFLYVEGIPKTSRGKHKLLIQKLPVNFGDYI